jgi:hypothetical protein
MQRKSFSRSRTSIKRSIQYNYPLPSLSYGMVFVQLTEKAKAQMTPSPVLPNQDYGRSIYYSYVSLRIAITSPSISRSTSRLGNVS